MLDVVLQVVQEVPASTPGPGEQPPPGKPPQQPAYLELRVERHHGALGVQRGDLPPVAGQAYEGGHTGVRLVRQRLCRLVVGDDPLGHPGREPDMGAADPPGHRRSRRDRRCAVVGSGRWGGCGDDGGPGADVGELATHHVPDGIGRRLDDGLPGGKFAIV